MPPEEPRFSEGVAAFPVVVEDGVELFDGSGFSSLTGAGGVGFEAAEGTGSALTGLAGAAVDFGGATDAVPLRARRRKWLFKIVPYFFDAATTSSFLYSARDFETSESKVSSR